MIFYLNVAVSQATPLYLSSSRKERAGWRRASQKLCRPNPGPMITVHTLRLVARSREPSTVQIRGKGPEYTVEGTVCIKADLGMSVM